ncbi:MAG: polysaccharide pyruvyl transferase family protein [Treponema sp.]|nr:polysaccharide pyruvyl transferase family protein [Treponema sp.]
MKIGIMTLWWSNDNYGQILQCYALQKYLRDRGHDAFLIRYKPENLKHLSSAQKLCFAIKHPFETISILSSKMKPVPILSETEKKNNIMRGFDSFRAKYIITTGIVYESYHSLCDNPPEADMYIVGSDQIWNINNEYADESINTWFLKFVPNKSKRASYAASFGRDNLSKSMKKLIKPLLEDFSNVTVRENSGKNIAKSIGINAHVVCDPTLLLSKEQYYSLFSMITVPNKKYVFLYLLSNTCTFSVHKLEKWAKKNKLELIYVSGNAGWKHCNYDDEGIKKSYLTIPEWLSCLANAEYVITNSFHCSLFSLLFEKKIAVVPLEGSVKNTNNRIDSLFFNLHVQKKEIKNNNFEILRKLNFQKIDMQFIENSKKILNSFGDGL